MKVNDLRGGKFGRLTVVSRAASRDQHAWWLCQCDCGSPLREVQGRALVKKNGTRSCGCLIREHAASLASIAPRTHGDAQRGRVSTEYRSWSHMKDRCTNSRNKNFADYGRRGISVCDRWLRFENFLADMGRKPLSSLTLDRIDNDGNYEPGNCRWATREMQARNRRAT